MLCPHLEEVSVGECVLEDMDGLLDFAEKVRRPELKTFRVALVQVFRADVGKVFDMLRVQRQDSEGMRVVHDMGGLMLEWIWDRMWIRIWTLIGPPSCQAHEIQG